MNQRALINSVSRSFALSLLWLPKSQRDAVGLSYLLARFADTLTDAGSWLIDERLAHLERWENAILKRNSKLWNLAGSLGKFSQADAQFLAEGESLLIALEKVPGHQYDFISEVLQTLIQGMKWDLKTFASATTDAPICGVADFQSFDWYCFSIAGCVGRFWVQIFALPADFETMAVSYGKALQRINILRDVQEDRARGRIYLPRNLLGVYELDSNHPWLSLRWSEFCKTYTQEAGELLLQGAYFCDSIPRGKIRLRFASMMPLMIGLKTLQALKVESWDKRIKISRPEVRGLVMLALLKSVLGLGITPWARKFMR